tara:strand:- start:135 stop:1337 length:1203 start_codon:yes stop_codon:yes gene_type:complete
VKEQTMILKKKLLINGLLASVVLLGASITHAEIIFSESFDNQPDWNSGLAVNDLKGGDGIPDTEQNVGEGYLLPNNWDFVYQNPTLSPYLGYPDKRDVIAIDAADSSKARGGTGKRFLQQRVSHSASGSFTSDGQLMKLLDGAGGVGAGYDAVYFEFYIAFDPTWSGYNGTVQNLAKLVRLASWNGSGSPFQAFPGGNEGPLFFWQYEINSYGVRNVYGMRGGPWGDNYYLTNAQVGDLPRVAMNYAGDTVGRGVGGTTPQITDKVNGSYISDNLNQTVGHEQIWGTGGTYTKVAFYVKMNSAPGVGDGQIIQWLDDVQMMNVQNIVWVPSLTQGLTEMPKWTSLSIGGNDFFKNYPLEDGRQEWWAIDDIKVSTEIPNYLLSDSNNTAPPKPPLGITVE